MLYTRKGDKGDTHFFGCDQRFSKTSERAEALGGVDEINSLIGVCKIKVGEMDLRLKKKNLFLRDLLGRVQEDLFIIQANLAGSDKKISKEKISYLESVIDEIEKQMPPIKTFFLAGGSEESALFDYARAVARKAERNVINLNEKAKSSVDSLVLSYLNRLSSFLYALARFYNFKMDIKEKPPLYQ